MLYGLILDKLDRQLNSSGGVNCVSLPPAWKNQVRVILLTHHRNKNTFFQLRWAQRVAVSVHATLCPKGSAPFDGRLLCLCVGVRKFGTEPHFLPVRPGSPPPLGGDWHAAFGAVFGPAAGCLHDHSWSHCWLLGHHVTQYQRLAYVLSCLCELDVMLWLLRLCYNIICQNKGHFPPCAVCRGVFCWFMI